MDPETEAKLKAVIELCEEGDPEACAFLGKEFYFGWNIDQDLDRALRYLTCAAEAGDAVSQFLVGFMHWSGRGTGSPTPKKRSDGSFPQRSRAFPKRCITPPRYFLQRIPKRTERKPAGGLCAPRTRAMMRLAICFPI